MDAFSQVLAAFTHEVGAGLRKQVVVLLDQAGWHAGPKVMVPEGIHLDLLPARWSKVNWGVSGVGARFVNPAVTAVYLSRHLRGLACVWESVELEEFRERTEDWLVGR